MIVTWQTFEHDGAKVEGQIFTPDKSTDNVVLFCLGFPGAGATLFEQRHAEAFVNEGNAVVVLRHNGTRLDSPFTPFMLNSSARLKRARDNNETLLGGGLGTMQQWLLEPYIALQTLKNAYKNIRIIGNSFGAVSALWSLTQEGAPVAQISNLLLLAGAQGTSDGSPMDILRIWQPQFLTMPAITDKIAMEAPMQVFKTLSHTYAELPARVSALPAHIILRYVVVANDEILKLFDTERFQTAIGGRGEIVMDTIDCAHPNAGLLAHDTPDYPSEKILELLS